MNKHEIPWKRPRKRNQKGLSFFGVGVENVDKKENERREVKLADFLPVLFLQSPSHFPSAS